ncbi:TrfA transcriptional repressor protein, putative [Ricinus communis]|uniref:TrfA transcriptional repressor protein, putative n=1 Tax=Ricinus communis TaxID=3988 RepID=B9TFM5_RICCO|nr:TrfA transcriptional repressor protein, putative [Ricinus communis]|eukprot:XP_002537044.1 uncharacterized protein LOC8270184 [Ricinus communis]
MTMRPLGEFLPAGRVDVFELLKKAEHKAKAKRPSTSEIAPSIARQLPLWKDDIRAIPNEILRSALFNAKNRNEARRFFKNEEIGVIGEGVRITYTGEELRQNDESVWLQLIHLAKAAPAGRPVEFTAYSMVQALRTAKSKPNPKHIERLCESLRRMQATSLSVYSPRLGRGISLSMIPRFEWQDEASGTRLPKWRVQIAPELVELFGDMHYTHLQWRQRLDLPSGLATWLHGYFASHRKPMPVKLTTLKKGAGCTTETPRKFKQLIVAALTELQRVGFLKRWDVDDNLVSVERHRTTDL